MEQFLAGLVRPLAISLSHTATLRDQVDEYPQIGEDDQHYRPDRLA
jgi:hypothetical protein